MSRRFVILDYVMSVPGNHEDHATPTGSSVFLIYGRHCPAPDLPHRSFSVPPDTSSASPYYETDAAAGAPVDYIVDDPYLPEQPGVGVQELDATVTDDSYYTGGAYYYVQAADDNQE